MLKVPPTPIGREDKVQLRDFDDVLNIPKWVAPDPDQAPDGLVELAEWTYAGLEANRKTALRRGVQEATRRTELLVESGNRVALMAALDRLVTMSAAFIRDEQPEWLSRGVQALVRVYESGFDSQGFNKIDSSFASGIPPAELWLAMLDRIEGLGALAVRHHDWEAVRQIALQRPEGHDFKHYGTWVRHALTEASRAQLFRVEQDGVFREDSVIGRARRYAKSQAELTSDLGARAEDKLLDSLCQFDYLACIAGMAKAHSSDGANYYPNFARFYSQRTLPVVRRLLTNTAMRQALAPLPDGELAPLIVALDAAARREGVRFDGWFGLNDDVIEGWFRGIAEPRP